VSRLDRSENEHERVLEGLAAGTSVKSELPVPDHSIMNETSKPIPTICQMLGIFVCAMSQSPQSLQQTTKQNIKERINPIMQHKKNQHNTHITSHKTHKAHGNASK
jgi:hypothetical protein